MLKIAEELIGAERDFFANASNISSYIMLSMEKLNWAGFYLLSGDELALGPFQGKPACVRIKMGSGVCGTAAHKMETVLVDNVHNFPGHIACDDASNSEIVVPLIFQEKLYGVMDIDSPEIARFSGEDKNYLEELANLLTKRSNIEKVINYYNS